MQREALTWRRRGLRVVLVPTMGALHEGHLSLVQRARRAADIVVMSIYVNPTQFGPGEDFQRYPRPAARDARLAREAGVDVLFQPAQLYPKDWSTAVRESDMSAGRCGRSRPGHFDGVCTVVLKLFQIIQPTAAVFGQKDAQQCDVIERMVRDLDVPVKIIRAPVIRDARGLALSSRNVFLSADEYRTAVEFARVLKQCAPAGGRKPAVLATRTAAALARIPGLEVDYVEAVGGRLCAAVRVGRTRLIDNVAIRGMQSRCSC